jgi:hypothetical protein
MNIVEQTDNYGYQMRASAGPFVNAYRYTDKAGFTDPTTANPMIQVNPDVDGHAWRFIVGLKASAGAAVYNFQDLQINLPNLYYGATPELDYDIVTTLNGYSTGAVTELSNPGYTISGFNPESVSPITTAVLDLGSIIFSVPTAQAQYFIQGLQMETSGTGLMVGGDDWSSIVGTHTVTGVETVYVGPGFKSVSILNTGVTGTLPAGAIITLETNSGKNNIHIHRQSEHPNGVLTAGVLYVRLEKRAQTVPVATPSS